MSSSRLAPLMRPRSIAVLGASPRPNTLGNNAVANLQRFADQLHTWPAYIAQGERGACFAELVQALLQARRG